MRIRLNGRTRGGYVERTAIKTPGGNMSERVPSGTNRKAKVTGRTGGGYGNASGIVKKTTFGAILALLLLAAVLCRGLVFSNIAHAETPSGETVQAEQFDQDFWTKVITSVAAIVVAVPVLIFVKPKDRNLNRSLKRRLSDFNRDLGRAAETMEREEGFVLPRKTVFNFSAALNAMQKLAQQAAYENDNVAIDAVRSRIGDAKDIFSSVRFSKDADRTEFLSALRGVREHTAAAEATLGGILDNERRIRAKKQRG